MNKNLLLVLVFYFLPFIGAAQNFEFNGDFLLFREAKTKQPVLIVNDSLVYKGLSMKRIAFKHSEYPGRLNEYAFFNIGKKTYLVHDGCGPVLEYRNDSIVKINDNYLQRNQYGNAHFVYHKEIYFYGGYGLFTFKNILTKYNFSTKDWIEVQTQGEKAQEPRAGAYSFLKGDDLFVFGGVAKDENEVTANKLLDNKVWRLHLPTMQWFCVGNYDNKLIKTEPGVSIHDFKKLYLTSSVFSEIDFYSNKIKIYNRNYFPNVLGSYLEGKSLIGVYCISSKKFFHVGDISEFKGKLRNSSVFITPVGENNNFLYTISVSILALILLLFLFRKKIKMIIKPFKGIIYNEQKHVFLYKGKPILIFEEQEKKVLFYLLDNLNQFVSLNELNQLFENNGNTETISATVKRREQAVSGLLTKVSKICGIEENKLLLERKNSGDKRIKDILLLPNLLKKIN
jgi:hypothetical protein